ncbi:DUF1441 family protein [Aromatoleum toluclasticum]|uniref:DUF1441 family protein n=1 Tax=Aromatoleum toluclasticum TaxID=92003 RepID=UPI001D1880FA|nr:DUF1441 family protein [Aromatoleum toluclasticum]MCC4114665.1 DUF1441 family protein [Aromatoleum toluclasticum]
MTNKAPVGQHGGKRPGAGRPRKSEQADHNTTFARAKAKREAYKAEREELAYRKEAGELCEVAEVQQAVSTAFAAIASELRSIPDHLERRGDATPEQAERISQAIDDAMEVLADRLAALCPDSRP